MATFSSVAAVKGQALTTFTAAYATQGTDGGQVQVYWGTPRIMQRECVVLGEVRQAPDQRFHQLGHRKRDERYDLNVYLMAADPRFDTQQEQTERAYALGDVLATYLITDAGIRLGGVPSGYEYLEVQVATPDLDEWYDDGFVALLSFALRVHARF